MMRRIVPSALAALALAIAGSAASAAPFTAGNLVVLRVGNGTTTYAAGSGGRAAAAFLDEYTAAGALVQSIALPTSASGSNNPLTFSISATSEGILSRSPNGSFLAFAGYGAAPGTNNVNSTAANANRVFGLVDGLGVVDTRTQATQSTLYNNNNIRSAVTVDGTRVWTAGNGTNTTGGIQSFAVGSTTYTTANRVNPTTGVGSQSNQRTVAFDFAGNLLYGNQSTANGNLPGIFGFSGAPTASGSTPSALVTSSTASPYQFFTIDANTNGVVDAGDRIYFADDGANGATGGVFRSDFNGTSWSGPSLVANSSIPNLRGLTGELVAGNVVFFGTTATANIPGTSGNVSFSTSLVTFTEGVSGAWSTLASFSDTGSANSAIVQFRGIAFAPVVTPIPEPTTFAALGLLMVGGAIMMRRRTGKKAE
jgi:hypothetical protein